MNQQDVIEAREKLRAAESKPLPFTLPKGTLVGEYTYDTSGEAIAVEEEIERLNAEHGNLFALSMHPPNRIKVRTTKPLTVDVYVVDGNTVSR